MSLIDQNSSKKQQINTITVEGKKATTLNLVGTDIIVVSGKFKHNENKYFIGYSTDTIISFTSNEFDDSGENMSFKIEDDYIFS